MVHFEIPFCTAGEVPSIWGEIVPEDGVVDVPSAVELDGFLYSNHTTLVLCAVCKIRARDLGVL